MARRSSLLKAINAIARDQPALNGRPEVARQRQAREIQHEYQLRERELAEKQGVERLARDAERAALQATKVTDRAAKEAERAAKQAAKEAKEKYLLELIQNVADRNAQLSEHMDELRSVLEHTLTVDDTISFDSLRPSFDFPPFSPPAKLAQATPEPRREDYLAKVKKPNGLRWHVGHHAERIRKGAGKRWRLSTRRSIAWR